MRLSSVHLLRCCRRLAPLSGCISLLRKGLLRYLSKGKTSVSSWIHSWTWLLSRGLTWGVRTFQRRMKSQWFCLRSMGMVDSGTLFWRREWMEMFLTGDSPSSTPIMPPTSLFTMFSSSPMVNLDGIGEEGSIPLGMPVKKTGWPREPSTASASIQGQMSHPLSCELRDYCNNWSLMLGRSLIRTSSTGCGPIKLAWGLIYIMGSRMWCAQVMSTCRRLEGGLSCHPATLVGIDLCSSSIRTAWLWCATLANHLSSSPSQPIPNGLRLRWSCYLVRLLRIAQIS